MERYQDNITDDKGNAVVGAQITVTTYPGNQPATIYADQGGPAVGSVYSDENGRFGFYAQNGHYSLNIVGKGIVPFTVTDVVLNDSTDFGGSEALADNGYALQLAANRLMLTGGLITIPPGTWKVTSAPITLYPNTEVRIQDGATIDMSGAPSSAALFTAAGTKGTAFPLAANAVKSSSTASMAPADLVASGIVAGSWVKLASTAIFDPARTSSTLGELIQVDTINTATGALTFKTPLSDSYATADTATIAKLSLVGGIAVTGQGKIKGGIVGTSHQGVALTLCHRPFVGDGLHFESLNDRSIYLVDCIQPRVHRVSCSDAIHAATGYGISVTDATCDGLYTQIVTRNVRHLFTTNNNSANGGIPRRHILMGWSAKQSAYATGGSGGDSVDTHAAAEDIHIWDGVSHGSSSGGVNMECASGSVMNVSVYDSKSTGVLVWNWTSRPGDHVLSNVQVYRAGSYGIVVEPRGAAQDRLSMSNVGAVDCANKGIWLDGSYFPINNVSLSALNTLRGTSANPSVHLQNVYGGALVGASAAPANAASDAVRFQDCSDLVVSGVAATMPAAATGSAIRVNATAAALCKNITIDSCRTKDAAPSASYGIRVDLNAQNIVVGASNDMRQATTPISLPASTGNRGGHCYGSATYDPPNLVDGDGVNTTITLTGASLGDVAQATFSLSLQGILLTAFVSAANTVTVRFQNETGAAIDLASGTLKAVAFKI